MYPKLIETTLIALLKARNSVTIMLHLYHYDSAFELYFMVTYFTTRTPAVTDVLGSGRNVGALRPGRRVGFRSLAPGGQTTFPKEHIIFVMTTALTLLKLGPHSKRGK